MLAFGQDVVGFVRTFNRVHVTNIGGEILSETVVLGFNVKVRTIVDELVLK